MGQRSSSRAMPAKKHAEPVKRPGWTKNVCAFPMPWMNRKEEDVVCFAWDQYLWTYQEKNDTHDEKNIAQCQKGSIEEQSKAEKNEEEGKTDQSSAHPLAVAETQ